MSRPLLGEILLDDGEITKEELDNALEIQKNEGGLIGIILVNQGVITEQTLVQYLTMQAERITKGD